MTDILLFTQILRLKNNLEIVFMKIVGQERKSSKENNIQEEEKLLAVIYGPKRKSKNLVIDSKEFKNVFKMVGYSKVVDFEVEGEKKKGKVLIREVQFEPVTGDVIHVSFFELDLKKPVTADVPVETKGASKAVQDNIGFLVLPFETIEVRSLPSDLPDKLIIDISNLDEIGDNVSVDDLELPKNVELASDIASNATVAYIAPPQKEIVEEEKEELEVEEGEEGEGVEEGEEGEVQEDGEAAEGEEGEETEKPEKE